MKKRKYYKNVKPKFHEGEWVTNGTDCTFQIAFIENDTYYDTNNCGSDIESTDKSYHLWTIEDAKDGDVLIDKSGSRECPFIFKETKPSDIKTDVPNPLTVLGYCGIGGAGFTKSSGWGDTANCIYYPATKKQRDDLLKVMNYEKTKILQISRKIIS